MGMNYPELYYRIYPKAIECIDRYFQNNPHTIDISDEVVEALVDEVYEMMLDECPELDQDPIERRRGRYRSLQRPIYGRRRLARDIIAIIIISELLRRLNPRLFY
ncbi:MAG: hypothetical protein GX080_06575 [Tissierellia bacterium]|nr:hypothetical protein [Tissierellia bacterium]